MKKYTLIIATILIIGAAGYVGGKYLADKTQSQTEEVSSKEQRSAEGLYTYTDLKISLKLPPSWIIEKDKTNHSQIIFKDPEHVTKNYNENITYFNENKVSLGTLLDNMSMLSIKHYSNFEEWLSDKNHYDTRFENCSSVRKCYEAPDTHVEDFDTIGGRNAFHVIACGEICDNYYIIEDKDIYEFSTTDFFGNAVDIVEPVIKTITFLK